MTLKDYMQANKDLELKVAQREKHLAKLEGEIKILQDSVQKVDQAHKETKLKHENAEKHIEELQQQNHVLRTKMVSKKQKLTGLREQLKASEQQFDEQGQNFGRELERVQRLCEDFSSEMYPPPP